NILSISVLIIIIISYGACAHTVDGSVGGSVLLPCIFTDSPSTKVFWRDKDDNVVLNIENGSPVYSSQNMRYRKRVTSIKEEIGKGNFSILMKNLQVNDSDTYVCTILPGVNERRVQLTVTGEFNPTCQKSNNKTPLGFRSGRLFLPITPLQVPLSLPTWALKSPRRRTTESPVRALSSFPPRDTKKTGYSELLFAM
uniref:Ig-like domain-containing protein n=1 Tax=Oryzias melastigma TaxID=30732 RepID=A0A3B3BJC0_ORYME